MRISDWSSDVCSSDLGLSVSAVLRRLRRLREEKVIVADIAVINPALTGSALTMHVLVRMQQAGPQTMDGFAREIARHPEVTGAWDVTGDDDFLLKIQVGSMEEYDVYTRRVLDRKSTRMNDSHQWTHRKHSSARIK